MDEEVGPKKPMSAIENLHASDVTIKTTVPIINQCRSMSLQLKHGIQKLEPSSYL